MGAIMCLHPIWCLIHSFCCAGLPIFLWSSDLVEEPLIFLVEVPRNITKFFISKIVIFLGTSTENIGDSKWQFEKEEVRRKLFFSPC
jgi:hypothetical protein